MALHATVSVACLHVCVTLVCTPRTSPPSLTSLAAICYRHPLTLYKLFLCLVPNVALPSASLNSFLSPAALLARFSSQCCPAVRDGSGVCRDHCDTGQPTSLLLLPTLPHLCLIPVTLTKHTNNVTQDILFEHSIHAVTQVSPVHQYWQLTKCRQ